MRTAILLLLVATAGCALYPRRNNREELADCLYHARNDLGMVSAEREFVLAGCQAVFEMRERRNLR